jgi:coenzyme F420-dependent glucose-6-phosphate dehydrogenase
MTRFGLTLSSEEHPPRHLVEMASAAEEAGFDFVSISDHFHPWITEQGHSPFVWSVLGAISEATETIEVVVGVTCPIMRIHPVINAHATATTASLLSDRFVWGVGSGEALNEHVLGDSWPTAPERLEMLAEAIAIVRQLWTGDSVSYRGDFFSVEDARLFDLPESPPQIVVSAFGVESAQLAAELGDGLWTTGVPKEVLDAYREAGGDGPIYSQLSLCWAETLESALERAFRQWPNTALPGQLAQDLRTVTHVEQAVQLVTEEDLAASSMPLGPDPQGILDSVDQAIDAGIDHIYLHQIGDPLQGFLEVWEKELKPELHNRR